MTVHTELPVRPAESAAPQFLGELLTGGTQWAGRPLVGTEALPEPPARAAREPFVGARSVRVVRRWVMLRAALAGMSEERTADLVEAVNELVTNAVVHGGGHGLVAIWHEGESLVCQVRDHGPDRRRSAPVPALAWECGRGLWLVNRLCDFVQIRSSAEGTLAQVHVPLG